MYRIKCTCGQLFQFDDSLIDKTIRCRTCERAIRIERDKSGNLRAVGLGPEISLPAFVQEANRAMLEGDYETTDKVCLNCGAVNPVDAVLCEECAEPWSEEEFEDYILDVTEDEKDEGEDTDAQEAAHEEDVAEAVADTGTFELVSDEELVENGSQEGDDKENSQPIRIPRRKPISQRLRRRKPSGIWRRPKKR